MLLLLFELGESSIVFLMLGLVCLPNLLCLLFVLGEFFFSLLDRQFVRLQLLAGA